MSQRSNRIASVLLALTLIITMLPVGALPPGLAGMGAGEVLAQAADVLLNPTWSSTEIDDTNSMAWGDYDNDGDLDLIFGNVGQNRLYRNDNGVLTTDAIWSSAESADTLSIAWGDVDGDGDLDLAVGNDDQNRLYRNDGTNAQGQPQLTLVWSSAESDVTYSIAWGDVDGDGDLDLAVGNTPTYNSSTNQNEGGQNRLYRNDGVDSLGNPQLILAWSTIELDSTRSVAWGDVDGDGDLDLAVGNTPTYNPSTNQNEGGQNRLYRNDGIDSLGNPRLILTWSTIELDSTRSVAWGDVDGDGDLDLAVGNDGQNRLYHNDGTNAQGQPQLTLVWTSPEYSSTSSIAWGDVDGDGDLDLAVGNMSQANRLYRNDGTNAQGQPQLTLTWSFTESNATYSIAWGDVDGDGDLDLAIGKDDQNRLYRNDRITLSPSAAWLSSEIDDTNSIAWGDVDGDGDLDLAVGNDDQNRLYRNDGTNAQGQPQLTLVWSSAESDVTYSIAWGDVDGDGDLDLAVGNTPTYNPSTNQNEGGQNRLYRNDGVDSLGNPRLILAWSTIELDSTRSVAWGDVDGDGDLDLAVGNTPTYNPSTNQNEGGQNRLYRNDGTNAQGQPQLTLVWASSESDVTYSIAWGDVDGDGDLDLATGNWKQSNRLYRNDNGTLTASAAWSSAERTNTYSIAWGDADGDGDLDLATANDGPNQLYRNDNGTLTASIVWSSIESGFNSDIAWGDVDGDGDLDLAIGTYGSPLYRNDSGTLTTSAAWSSTESRFAYSIAWGDVDGDGDLDLATANNGQNLLYVSTRNNSRWATTPAIAITTPAANPPLHPAGGMATPQILGGPTLTFTYTLSHLNSVPAGRLHAQYSLDGGGIWQDASPAVITDTSKLTSSPGGSPHTYIWDTAASYVFGQTDQAVLRLIADPDVKSQSGPFLYSGTSATSPQFRLRGSIARVVDSQNQPVAGAQVYHLPSGTAQGATSLTNWLTHQPLTSNQLGYVNSRDPLNPGDRLAALQVISDSAKFTLYHTSPIDLSSGLPDHQITSTGVQTLTVSPSRPLIAFKLDVALEWDARNDAAFLLQLRRDLQRAAELLYDWTDGQATLGAITIYHDKDHWEDVTDPVSGAVTYGADIQIYASNRLRPNSSQGGIVTKTLSETLTISGAPRTLVYEPGALRMPATWNRNGDPGGVLGEDWPRTLAHELGHFALFLDDNYIGLDATNNLISVESCRGAMSDPYRDDWSEFQPDGAEWNANCANTLSARTAGRSDWATIKTFYDNAGLNFRLNAPTSFNAHSGPDNLALALTQITDSGAGQASTAREAYVTLLDAAGKPYQPGAAARAVLYHGTGNGERAIDLGAPTGDLLLVRGARPGDTLCVYERLKQLVGCTAMSVATTRLTMRTLSSWRPDIQITPVTSTTVALRLPAAGVGGLAAGETLAARLFPDQGQAITVALTLTGGDYVGTGVFATPPFDALVRVCVADGAGLCLADGAREAVADYSLGGEPAPRRRKKGRRRRRAPALSSDGQAILFTDDVSFSLGQFYAFQSIDQLPTPPAWATPVGFGYRLGASDDALRAQIGNTAISLGYFPADVPAGAEEGIRLYYYPVGGSAWDVLPTTLSLDDNTASAKARGEGIYALMASAPLALDPGWNLVYRYPGATQALPAALAGVSYATPITTTSAYTYTLVYGYDDGDPDDPWKLYAPGLPAPWDAIVNDLGELTNGGGYWIHSSAEITAPLRPSLDAGDGILSAPPATYYGLAPADLSGPLDVAAWVGEGEDARVCGSTTTRPVTVNGKPGQGFSLNVLANGGGDAMGCGYPDAAVRVGFAAGGVEVGSYDSGWDNSALIPLGLSQTKIYLPLVARAPQPQPDLQILDVRIAPAPLDSGEDYAIEVTIRNAGAAPVEVPFWVDLYLGAEAAPLPGEGWPDAAPFGASWRVYGLAAGETLLLSSLDTGDPADPGKNYTLLPTFLEGEVYTLYAQADVYTPDGDSRGAILEGDEANNIAGPYALTP